MREKREEADKKMKNWKHRRQDEEQNEGEEDCEKKKAWEQMRKKRRSRGVLEQKTCSLWCVCTDSLTD